MKRRLLSLLMLLAVSIGVLLFPWAGNYQSPLMWAECRTDAPQRVDVFMLGATADIGGEGDYQSSTWRPQDRAWQERLLNLQESVYLSEGRTFAPFYRQGCLSIYYLEDAARQPYLSVAYEDVRAAFLYYMEHLNQGRPIILAGYSQGADLGLRLMEEFFDDPQLQSQLVAAYLIGWRITKEDLEEFPHLKMAEGAEDTGVIVSFNSEAPGVRGSVILPEGGYTYGINPLSWETGSDMVDKGENPGTVDLHMDGSYTNAREGYSGCYRDPDRGTIIVPDIDVAEYPPGEPVFVEGCYHNYELELYYWSLRENVSARVEAYFREN